MNLQILGFLLYVFTINLQYLQLYMTKLKAVHLKWKVSHGFPSWCYGHEYVQRARFEYPTAMRSLNYAATAVSIFGSLFQHCPQQQTVTDHLFQLLRKKQQMVPSLNCIFCKSCHTVRMVKPENFVLGGVHVDRWS
jgi:hypothetical protein